MWLNFERPANDIPECTKTAQRKSFDCERSYENK